MDIATLRHPSEIASDRSARRSIATYSRIMELWDSGCDPTSGEFRRLFVGFYRVRRTSAWCDGFFSLMRPLGGRKWLGIREVLDAIDSACGGDGRVELSFASKLLHTVNPSMPIWDSLVRARTALPGVPTSGCYEDRASSAEALYGRLCAQFNDALSDGAVKDLLREMETAIPECSRMTDVKKLDFLMWLSRDVTP